MAFVLSMRRKTQRAGEWIELNRAKIFADNLSANVSLMPFAVRLYLGRALKQSLFLEADAAMLFVLETTQTFGRVFTSQNQMNARQRFRGTGVNAHDTGVRIGAAQYLHVQHSR